MALVFQTQTAKATGGGYSRCFPSDSAGVFRTVTLYALADVNIRQVSATASTTVLKGTTLHTLGLAESADIEVEAVGAATTVYCFGSHPFP